MSELSPEARGLVDDWHAALRPSSGDRARVKAALAARLGGAAFFLPQQASAAVPKSLFVSQKLYTLSAGLGVGLLAAGAYFLSPASSGIVEGPPVKPTAVVTGKPQPAPVLSSSPAPTEVEPLTAPSPPSPPRRQTPADSFAEEVAILSKATSELRAGRANEGLRLLEEHERKFPNGRLAEERRAARIQALCSLGRLPEAEAELARLKQSSPRSPHLARAQRACGLAP
jgi:hypothetical protein